VTQLFICTRFGLSIKDPAWIEHRLPLFASVTLPSLLRQEDQSFQWAIFVDADLDEDIRYALHQMIERFDGRAFIHSDTTHTSRNVLALAQARGAEDPNGRLLTARIDDDDAWSLDTVGEVRSRAAAWRKEGEGAGLCVSFERGLEWIMYDMLDVDALQEKGARVTRKAAVRPLVFPFHSMSIFVYAKASAGISAISAGHRHMGSFLGDKGYAVELVSGSEPRWLYCRHKQVQSTIQRARGEEIAVTLADLERDFGIDATRSSEYMTASGAYGYSLMKRTDVWLSKLDQELGAVRQKIADAAGDAGKVAELRQRESELERELANVSGNVVGDPGSAPIEFHES